MKKRILLLTVLVLILSLAFVSCKQKAISKLEIVEGLEHTYTVGDTPDFSNVKVKVVYNDGSSIEVGKDDAKLVIGELDTATAGTKDLTVTYDGFSTTVKVTVKAASAGDGGNGDGTGDGDGNKPVEPEFTIFNVSYDDNLTAFLAENGNKTSFRGDTNNNYVVGSINPFRFTLTIDGLDKDLNPAIVTSYQSLSKVYLVEGDVVTLLEGDALANYVVIDESAGNNSFDFTDAAIGKTFKLETRPAEGVSEEDESRFTKSLVVDVVDGYNIYEAWELNLITNDANETIGGQNDVKQLDAVTNFLKNNGLVRPENLKGVVLHKNFNVKVSDLPAEYFYTLDSDVPYTYTDKEGKTQEAVWEKGTKFFYDVIGVYNVEYTDEAPEFSIHGNYFTIYTYELPCVAPKGHGYNDNDLSGAELFRFDTNPDLLDQDFDHSKYVTNISRLYIRDDNGSDDDNSKSMRHKLGLLGFKTLKSVTYMDQVNIYSYFISIHANRDCQTVNINDCDFYNAWNNHILTWSDNTIDGDSSTTIHQNHTHITVNVTGDSRIAKCGGPVIINMLHAADKVAQSQSAVDINLAEGTIVYSYVTGQEAWFTSYGATGIAMQIKQLNALVASKGGTFLTTLPNSGDVTFFNAVMVNMAYVQDASNVFSNNDLDGSFSIGDRVLLDMNDTQGNFGNPYVSAIAGHAALGKAPIFQSSNGSVVFGLAGGTTQGLNPFTQQPDVGTALGQHPQYGVMVAPDGLYELNPDPSALLPLNPAGDGIASGDYLTLYYNNIGLVFGYNETDITEY